jgi:hypothetical protein
MKKMSKSNEFIFCKHKFGRCAANYSKECQKPFTDTKYCIHFVIDKHLKPVYTELLKICEISTNKIKVRRRVNETAK